MIRDDDLSFANKEFNSTPQRMKYNVDGLKSPNLMQQFNAILGAKFHQLIDLTDTDVYVETFTNTFNTAVSDTAT